ncbi:MAG: hypothetical protein JWO30_721 [Fibrobacteres bacterium]|nr:hypothetical protein [Fibrobacterota bacterium]
MNETPKSSGPAELKESIERLDAMLASETAEEKIRAGMGIRLALGMAQELKSGKSLGSETADLVSDWVAHYGQDTVNAAVIIAREFLIKPNAMRTALGKKLGLEKGEGDEEAGEDAEDDLDGEFAAEGDELEDGEPGEAPE